MALDDLLARLQRRGADTPDTSCNPVEVSAKPAPIEACTLDTPDTSQKCNADEKAAEKIVFAGDSAVDRSIAPEGVTACRDCEHFAQPGKSDGYCARRNDLPRAYGANHPLRKLPADDGASCNQWILAET